MQVRVREIAWAELACRTRLPFRFGAVTVTQAPLLHLRVVAEGVDGRAAVGMASDLLVPKWFRKDLDRPPEADQEALRASVRDAARRYTAHGFLPAFEHWLQVQNERIESQPPLAPELLEVGFGVALVERALLDAICRLAGTSFWSALQSDLFRRRLLLSPIGHWSSSNAVLPDRPLPRIAVRHTVGRLDPLRAADVPAAERLHDGMPQALDEVLAQHGVRWLKVKIGGGAEVDVPRLCAIGRLLADLGLDDVKVTLDGNEQFEDFAALRAVWMATGADPHGRRLLQRVQWVEQPLPRSKNDLGEDAFDARQWTFCPLVLDEGDVQLGTFLAGRYRGVSVKNCKGVLRAFANREETARLQPHRFQTSEDLTNLPVLALQQDLTTASCLDLGNSERNGHHYFPGLAHLPTTVVEAALRAHPDLYERTGAAAKLRIEHGMLAIGSLHGIGYGCDQTVLHALDRGLDWTPLG
jgi:hypothetical protein